MVEKIPDRVKEFLKKHTGLDNYGFIIGTVFMYNGKGCVVMQYSNQKGFYLLRVIPMNSKDDIGSGAGQLLDIYIDKTLADQVVDKMLE